MDPPISFKYFEDCKNQFGNVITTYCKTGSDGGYDNEGLPESLISDFYIICKQQDASSKSKYILHRYHSEKWYGGEDEDSDFYFESSTALSKNMFNFDKHLFTILKSKIDKNKEVELYDIVSFDRIN